MRMGMDGKADTNVKDPGAMIPDELLTQRELARRLKVCERKVQGDKSLPRITYGRNVRYSWLAVLAYLERESEGHA